MLCKTFIYVLFLEKDKYYIGTTNNSKFKLKDHIKSNWTNRYKPLIIKEFYEYKNKSYVDKLVLEYMKKYGINNVRGSNFDKTILDYDIKENLKRSLK